MKPSADPQVQKFLEGVKMCEYEQYMILQKLREIVFHIHPKTSEKMMYGGIMFCLQGDFGGLFVRKNHVSFEFGNGFAMNDPKKFLEGAGKFRRHIKLRTFDDIADKEVASFVAQISPAA